MNRTRRDIEALADLFVGIPATTVPAPDDTVIRLIEGHLPVRASLWRHPAIPSIVGDEQATVLEIDDRQIHITMLGHDTPVATDLEHVIAPPHAGHTWIIAGPVILDAVANWSAYDEVVVLTGADQAATVAAYRQIKAIATSTSPPAISVIMAGSPDPIAQAAVDRLLATSSAHLGVAPTCRGIISQMDAGEAAKRCSVAMTHDGISDVIASIRARASASRPASPIPPAPRETTESHTPYASPVPLKGLPAVAACSRPTRTETPSSPDAVIPEGLTAVHIAELPQGVTAAVDSAGALHVIAHNDAAALEVARCWAVRHRALLAGSIEQMRSEVAVQADLIVGDVHRASDLADGPWRVHLRLGGQLTEVSPRTPPKDH